MSNMYLSHKQEAFSDAFVRAVSAAAGFRVQSGPAPDDDSIDLTIAARGPMGTVRSPKLDVQLKCALGLPSGDPVWPFDLKIKNYEDLRHEDLQVPRVLVIVAVPRDAGDWLDQTEERLILRHCAWWASLRGHAETMNNATKRISIPRVQRFDVSQLTEMMQRIGRGGTP